MEERERERKSEVSFVVSGFVFVFHDERFCERKRE